MKNMLMVMAFFAGACGVLWVLDKLMNVFKVRRGGAFENRALAVVAVLVFVAFIYFVYATKTGGGGYSGSDEMYYRR